MLSNFELELIELGVKAAYLVPFIDDVEDFVWETIWHQAKELALSEGLARTKDLFDVVDVDDRRGWSAKTLVVPGQIETGREFEFVIQRADIFKKQELLGFSGLSIESDPNLLGSAILTHWRDKVDRDSAHQGVDDARIAILLKNRSRTKFAVMDELLEIPPNEELTWGWANAARVGLQARDQWTGQIRYKWYPNQTQLFERMTVPSSARFFSFVPMKLDLDQLLHSFRQAGYIS